MNIHTVMTTIRNITMTQPILKIHRLITEIITMNLITMIIITVLTVDSIQAITRLPVFLFRSVTVFTIHGITIIMD